MADVIRVGLVGATVTVSGSGWGADAHVPALKAVPGYQIKAVCTAHEASAKSSAAAFGADLAFHDFDAMVERKDVDLISVVVRVPLHHKLVMQALQAGKAVCCEWPLGNGLNEAQQMAALARKHAVPNMVMLQSRSDPAIRYARELIDQGYVGEVLFANLKAIAGSQLERRTGRIWQAIRSNGANTLTVLGGHTMDTVRYILGEFAEVSARIATRISQWRNTDTGETMTVDAPDTVGVIGKLKSNAEASMLIATAPSSAPGYRLEIYGRKGTLSISYESMRYIGPFKIFGAQGGDKLAELPVPERHTAAPASTPLAQNVANAYARFARALHSNQGIDPDFDTAVGTHRLIDAIERSAAERRIIEL